MAVAFHQIHLGLGAEHYLRLVLGFFVLLEEFRKLLVVEKFLFLDGDDGTDVLFEVSKMTHQNEC